MFEPPSDERRVAVLKGLPSPTPPTCGVFQWDEMEDGWDGVGTRVVRGSRTLRTIKVQVLWDVNNVTHT